MDWFAIVTTPRGELRADEELAEAGLEHFTPTYKLSTHIRHTKGRIRTINQPLLRGYTFAQLDFSYSSHHPTLLKKCKHIVEPIRICGIPVPVQLAELRQLRLLCDAGAFDQGRQRGQDNRFRDGDTVRITSGPLQGISASFRETAGGLRPRSGFVRVCLERLFGQRDFETDVRVELIEAA
jgi:transcription antitermination factor NusG